MKTIKLIIVFLLVLGGVVAAFLVPWTEILGIDKDRKELGPTKRLSEFCQKSVDGRWANVDDWNADTFMRNCNQIEQYAAKGVDVQSIKEYNRQKAVKLVYDKVFAEWKLPSCSKSKIDGYHAALNVIEDEYKNNTSRDQSVIEIRRVYKVYNNAYNFSRKGFGLSPGFKTEGEDVKWNNFSTYAENQIKERDAILNNDDYKAYLSNIAGIQKGLNDVPNKLSAAKVRFYENLANEIIDHYKKIDKQIRLSANLKDLRETRAKFKGEYKEPETLANFYMKFKDDVDANENKMYNR